MLKSRFVCIHFLRKLRSVQENFIEIDLTNWQLIFTVYPVLTSLNADVTIILQRFLWISQNRNILLHPFKRLLSHVPYPSSIYANERTRGAKMRISSVEINGFRSTLYHAAVNSITKHQTVSYSSTRYYTAVIYKIKQIPKMDITFLHIQEKQNKHNSIPLQHTLSITEHHTASYCSTQFHTAVYNITKHITASYFSTIVLTLT